jgi:hypothetical protein
VPGRLGGTKTRSNRHGDADTHATGTLVGHGRYELFAAVFFGGRRRRVFTQLAAAIGAPQATELHVGCGSGYSTRVMAARRCHAPQLTLVRS